MVPLLLVSLSECIHGCIHGWTEIFLSPQDNCKLEWTYSRSCLCSAETADGFKSKADIITRIGART